MNHSALMRFVSSVPFVANDCCRFSLAAIHCICNCMLFHSHIFSYFTFCFIVAQRTRIQGVKFSSRNMLIWYSQNIFLDLCFFVLFHQWWYCFSIFLGNGLDNLLTWIYIIDYMVYPKYHTNFYIGHILTEKQTI